MSIPSMTEQAARSGDRHGHASAVVVVDDDDCIRDSLAAILEDEGFAVETAENGRAALALLDRIAQPSLMLIDLRMPVMDGVELIEALRGDDRFSAIPLIAFSAASTVSPPADVPFLAKPIGVEPLLAAVRAHARG